MRSKASDRSVPHAGYWKRRVRSKSFKRALTALLVQELKSLSRERVEDVLDAERVRTIIREWDTRAVNREVVADLVIRANRRMTERLNRRGMSLGSLLGPHFVADIDAILKDGMRLSAHAEDFVAKIVRQEFVRGLFTDIVFSAIVSFYQKVNPLFGALTMRVMEEQIKGFIRLFMPMLQQQATAFAISKENQRILFDFARSITRQLLNEPLAHYATLISAGQRTKAEALIRKAVASAALDSVIRNATLAAWDDLYETIRDKKMGDLLRLDEHTRWLAERSVAAILPALARPHVLGFVAAEMALAVGKP